MTKSEMVKAWKDQDYFMSLGANERAALPAHPAGDIDLARAELDNNLGKSFGTFTSSELTPYCSPCGNEQCH